VNLISYKSKTDIFFGSICCFASPSIHFIINDYILECSTFFSLQYRFFILKDFFFLIFVTCTYTSKSNINPLVEQSHFFLANKHVSLYRRAFCPAKIVYFFFWLRELLCIIHEKIPQLEQPKLIGCWTT